MKTRAGSTSSESVDERAAAWTAGDLAQNPHQAADKAQRVQKMFAAIATRYDLNNRLHSLGRDEVWRRTTVKLCRVQPTNDVLDVACGTGDLTEAFANVGPKSITGLDFTAEMLEIAREKSRSRLRARSNANLPSPTYVQGDATALPFGDESFDIVSIAFGIRNVSDPAQALREFRRVLRPGGTLAVLEFSQPINPILRWLNNLYCGRIMPWTATFIARDRSGAYRYLPKSVSTFLEPAAFTELLQRSGFTKIEPQPLTFGVCTIYIARRA